MKGKISKKDSRNKFLWNQTSRSVWWSNRRVGLFHWLQLGVCSFYRNGVCGRNGRSLKDQGYRCSMRAIKEFSYFQLNWCRIWYRKVLNLKFEKKTNIWYVLYGPRWRGIDIVCYFLVLGLVFLMPWSEAFFEHQHSLILLVWSLRRFAQFGNICTI